MAVRTATRERITWRTKKGVVTRVYYRCAGCSTILGIGGTSQFRWRYCPYCGVQFKEGSVDVEVRVGG